MVAILASKVLLLGLFMSILNVIRHLYKLTSAYIENEGGIKTKYIISSRELVFLGLSISFILMTMFSGSVLN